MLILFGGRLTLAAAIEANGVSEYIGNASRGLGGLHALFLLLAITAITVFMSELTSRCWTKVQLRATVLGSNLPM